MKLFLVSTVYRREQGTAGHIYLVCEQTAEKAEQKLFKSLEKNPKFATESCHFHTTVLTSLEPGIFAFPFG